MARAHYRENIQQLRTDGSVAVLAGATVEVFTPGTLTPTPVLMYDADVGGNVLTNPLTSDAAGLIEFYMDTDERVDLRITATGFTTTTVAVDVVNVDEDDLTAAGLAAETAARVAADAVNAAAISTEATTRGTADTTEVTNRNTAIGVETTARTAAISAAIATEVTNRNVALAAADALLSFAGAPPSMRALKYVPLVGANLPIGDTDLYTVPANRKAVISSAWRVYNPSAGTITSFTQLKVAGVYYRAGASLVLTTLTTGGLGPAQAIVLNAGESISINCATTAGLNVRGTVIEFDATDAGFATARILALANGNNTLLTCPAGYSILPMSSSTNLVNFGGQVNVVNDSGGSLNYYVNVVPSGGAVGATNQLFPATAVADDAAGAFTTHATLAAGDVVSVNTSGGGAGQLAWINYYRVAL